MKRSENESPAKGTGGSAADTPSHPAKRQRVVRFDAEPTPQEIDDNVAAQLRLKRQHRKMLSSLGGLFNTSDVDQVDANQCTEANSALTAKEAKEEFGYELTSFNLDDELQEGEFDKAGTFVWKKDDPELKDAWFDEVGDYADLEKTQAARKDREAKMSVEAEATLKSPEESRKQLLEILKEDQETPMMAIQRLRQSGLEGSDKETFDLRKKKRKSAVSAKISAEAKEVLDRITESADGLMNFTGINAYYLPRASLATMPMDGAGAANTVYWQYRFVASPSELHGPFPGPLMDEWKKRAYFSDPSGKSTAEIRQVTATNDAIDGVWRLVTPETNFLEAAAREEDSDVESGNEGPEDSTVPRSIRFGLIEEAKKDKNAEVLRLIL